MLDVGILGPLEARRDGRTIPLGPPKQRAVLAVLLLESDRVVSTDRLVDTVWGDDAPPSVLASLQAYVSNLRRLLRDDTGAPSLLVRQPPGYRCLVPDEHIDVGRFIQHADAAQRGLDEKDWAGAVTEAQAGLDLWRGPVLADFGDEEWVRPVATALEERRTVVRQAHVTALLGVDHLGPAVARSGRLLGDLPLDERACWLHVVALYRAGRVPEGLAVLRAYQRRLDDELGLEPGPALRDLQGAILRQDPALASWPRSEVGHHGTVPGVVEPQRPPVEAPPEAPADDLVGRAAELAAADEALAAEGWVVLEGAAGIGKSRLAEACVQRWVSRGGAVSRSGCPDDASLPAWWPLRQVLSDLGADPGEVLVPPSGTDIDTARYATYERVRGVLAGAADRRPLLLFVDDVHWADATSLGFLTFLAQSRPVPGLAVLLTTRPVAGGSGGARLLAAAARLAVSRHISVPPLDPAEVAELAAQVSGGDVTQGEAAMLAARTGGNPFFVSEYARLPDEVRRQGGAPGAVRSVLERRLAGVDPEVMQVLRTAAVIGQSLDVDLLERVTRMDRDDLADLLDEAADEHLIVAGAAGGYEFVHALMREQVADGLAGLRRQRLHLRIGAVLADRGGADSVVRRASHLVAALPLGDAEETLEACRAAALEAESRWQSDDAAAWWGHALQAVDLLPSDRQDERDDLVAAQVAAYARAGRASTAIRVVDEALEAAMRTGRLAATGRIASTLLRSAGAWPWAVYPGEDPVADRLLERLLTLEEQLRDDPAGHVRVLATLAVGSYYDPTGERPDRLSALAIAEAQALGDPDLVADALVGRALAFSGIATRALELSDLLERLQALHHAQQRLDDVLCHNLGAMAHLTLGRIHLVEEDIRAGIVGCELLRLPVSRAQLRWMSAVLTQWHGDDLEAAAGEMRRGFEVHRATELYQSGVDELAALALAWDRGALADLEVDPTWPSLGWVDVLVRAARRSPGAEDDLAAECRRDEPRIWTTHGRLTLLAHTVCDLGRADLAPDVQARLTPFAGLVANIGQVGNVGPVDLALARLCLLQGDAREARAYLERATEVADRGRARRHLQRCRDLALQLDATAPTIEG